MLAPRILHFARNQVFWDCPSLSACEALPAGLPRPMDNAAGPDRHWRGRLQIEKADDLAGGNDQPLSAYWQTAVRKYTSCNITNRGDKLIALWGIAKLVKDAMLVEYAEGNNKRIPSKQFHIVKPRDSEMRSHWSEHIAEPFRPPSRRETPANSSHTALTIPSLTNLPVQEGTKFSIETRRL